MTVACRKTYNKYSTDIKQVGLEIPIKDLDKRVLEIQYGKDYTLCALYTGGNVHCIQEVNVHYIHLNTV